MEMRISRIGKRIRRILSGKEAGAALPAVLAFLVLGALIITPLLGFMITGLKAGQSQEKRTGEFYSADAGVEYAIRELNYGSLLEDGYEWLSNPLQLTPTPLSINNDSVDVWIEDLGEQLRFKITSTATDNATGSATTVVTHVVPKTGYQGNFFANGVTAVGDITIKGEITGDVECGGTLSLSPGTIVNGDLKCDTLKTQPGVIINGNVECGTLNNAGEINTRPEVGYPTGYVKFYTMVSAGTINPGPPIQTAYPPDLSFIEDIWPTEPNLTDFYLTQVIPDPDNPYDPATYYPFGVPTTTTGTIVNACGPLLGIPVEALGVYMGYDSKKGEGRDLTISTGDTDCAVKLTTTVFVTGDFEVTPNTKLDLNGQTVYALGTVKFAPGSLLTGSGVIIAIGQVDFQPSIVSGGDSGDEAVILHYGDDSIWRRQDNSSVGDLNDVWGISPDEVYAVGNGGLILKYDGADWNEVDTGLSLAPTTILNGVWCNPASGDIFAVGDDGATLWYDAGADDWTYEVHGSPNLNDVWGSVSDNVVYAVGDSGAGWRWEDGVWNAMATDAAAFLNGVWGSEADGVVFAVGAGGTMKMCDDGTTWGPWPYDSGTPRNLSAIWGVSEDDFYVVGDEGTIWHWYGGAWASMTINDGVKPQLRGVWGTAHDDVWAVGEQGSVLHYTGIGNIWTHLIQSPTDPQPGMYIPTTRNLNGVWGSACDDIFAVGQSVKDFIFVQSVDDFVKHLPNGDFFGSIAGKGECTLQPGGQLQAPSDLGKVNFPEYRYMRMDSYIVDQH